MSCKVSFQVSFQALAHLSNVMHLPQGMTEAIGPCVYKSHVRVCSRSAFRYRATSGKSPTNKETRF